MFSYRIITKEFPIKLFWIEKNVIITINDIIESENETFVDVTVDGDVPITKEEVNEFIHEVLHDLLDIDSAVDLDFDE